MEIIKWASDRRISTILSSSFESSLGLSLISELAAFADSAYRSQSQTNENKPAGPLPHGLGTFTWLLEDVPAPSSGGFNRGDTVVRRSEGTKGQLVVSMEGVSKIVRRGPDVSRWYFCGPLRTFPETPWADETIFQTGTATYYKIKLHQFPPFGFTKNSSKISQKIEPKKTPENPVTLIFLSGFMGSPEDWLPILQILDPEPSALCLELTLSRVEGPKKELTSLSGGAETVLRVLGKLGIKRVLLVGYSMGARLALEIAVQTVEGNHVGVEVG